jgi:site-specific recombinase
MRHPPITLVAFFVVPAALGFWWILRRLRAEYPRRQALGAAIAFAVFSPVPLIIGLVLGPIVRGYIGSFLGTESRLVAFSGALLGIVVMIAVMTFIPTLLALWITAGGRLPSS